MSKLQIQWQDIISKLTVCLIYAILYAIALNFFWQPGHIYAGGLTGISQIIVTLLDKAGSINLSFSIIYYLLNIPMILLAWFKINHKFVIFTIVAVTFASISTSIMPHMVLIKDPIICAVFGGVINGYSLGLALKNGISTGGMDALVVTLRQLTGQSVGVISMILNGVIMLAAGYLFGWPYAFYSLVSIFVSGKVTDLVYVKHRKVQVMIITQKPEEVATALQEKLTRGITVMPAYGAYKNASQNVLITVITFYEMEILDEIMKQVDPKAFVSVSQDILILSEFKDNDIV